LRKGPTRPGLCHSPPEGPRSDPAAVGAATALRRGPRSDPAVPHSPPEGPARTARSRRAARGGLLGAALPEAAP
ncbi:hypothetical protein WMY93_033963, partial [Mugilogobius chulae]